MTLSRRSFLRHTSTAALTLALSGLQFSEGAAQEGVTPAVQASAPTAGLPAVPTYRGWEDVYRQQWVWDKVVPSTHTRANCFSACSWNLYVKDGIVWREEQNAVYAAPNASVPDMNPRGCQKGGCYSQLMYEPSRRKYPMKRAGARGVARWSIHSIWRAERHLLRLQRGQPIMVMSVEDARARNLQDHDEARVYNDVGSFVIHVRPSPSVRPGQVIVYHAWENFQFRNWMQTQATVPSPWKPLHVLGGYGHVRYRVFGAAPNHGPRGTMVEVVRA